MMKSGERGSIQMLWTVALVVFFQLEMPMGEVLYSHPGALVPEKGSVLTYIDIGDTMHFEMDVVVHSRPSTYFNIIHCGSTNSIRNPGVWIDPHSTATDFRIHWNPESGVSTGVTMALEETYRLEMDMAQGSFMVKVNGEIKWDANDVGAHSNYDNEPCYFSDPWYDAADVTVTNLLITDGATNDPTKDPTRDPSADPTPEPTLEPTKDCSFLHIDQFLVDCSSEFDDHGARIQKLESNGNALETKMEEVMKHLDVLRDHGVQSGVTAVGPMPLGTGDYALYALAATNVLVVLCLTIYCVFVRKAPKYGKVAMYETEA